MGKSLVAGPAVKGTDLGDLVEGRVVPFAESVVDVAVLLELLRRAYTEARYERGYRIAKEDLDYLASRVHRLQAVTKTLCAERIAQYKQEALAFEKAR